MFTEILIRSRFKDFYIVPTVDNKIIYKPKDLCIEIDGLNDKLTPFYAHFHFADKVEYGKFKEDYESKLLGRGRFEAERVRESMVYRDKKTKKPFAKWEFFTTKKSY